MKRLKSLNEAWTHAKKMRKFVGFFLVDFVRMKFISLYHSLDLLCFEPIVILSYSFYSTNREMLDFVFAHLIVNRGIVEEM